MTGAEGHSRTSDVAWGSIASFGREGGMTASRRLMADFVAKVVDGLPER
jgi:hypothetical protein